MNRNVKQRREALAIVEKPGGGKVIWVGQENRREKMVLSDQSPRTKALMRGGYEHHPAVKDCSSVRFPSDPFAAPTLCGNYSQRSEKRSLYRGDARRGWLR